ncbi:iron ABC transporter permease [Flavobacterium sp. ASW18X]|uniref:iron ABC transporter permease n=1 Tax=Flavobacterium sp. ASW18X TaxID=2572595 RepID=UPI0010AE62D4|nr:iron ABC transporter permease [Flavobacterium sp. ASW18X]TKD60697.1 iron ABC transporter permease [Flavobacterium sp. ASW18X]
MTKPSSYKLGFIGLTLLLLLCMLISISLGSVSIPLGDTFSILLGQPTTEKGWEYIIWNYRLPKTIAAVLIGGGLAVSGLLMQTLFRNPLAGPFVLGISSGASLGAALLLLGGTSLGLTQLFWLNDVAIAIAASLGSFLVLLIVIVVANSVKDTMALLIIGLMFGSITSAVVSILSYFSKAEQLQRFIFWSYGSVGNLSWQKVGVLALLLLIGLTICLFCIKSLNAFLLGEQYAQSMGIPVKKTKFFIIIATGIVAGAITAFAGPIAFIGLAVPHLTRQWFKTMDHKILLPAVFLYGALLLLICDTIAQLPTSATVLPINAITSIVGAPVVIWLLVRKRKMLF